MDVQTETRSGVRLGQLYQAEREKTGELGHVCTFFITLLDKLLQQYLCDILTKLPQKICKLLGH